MKGLAVINDKFQIKFIRETSEDEYNHINEIINSMDKIEFIHSAKVPLVENYREIISLIDDYKNNKILPMVLKYYVIVKVQNFLSSVRGYIDTFAHTLSSEYGKDSEVYYKFASLKSEMYDKYFSYRFIEILRNFAQHRAIPINSLSFSSMNNEKVVKLIIQKQELLDDKKIKGPKIDDINANCSDEIDLLPHLTNMFSYLLTIHDEMIYSVIDENKCNEFFSFEVTFKGIVGSPILLDVVDLNYEDRFDIRPRFFNFNGIKQIISDLNESFIFMQTLYQNQNISQTSI